MIPIIFFNWKDDPLLLQLRSCLTTAMDSVEESEFPDVARFDEISPLGQNYKNIWQILGRFF